jgi:preprotein translocase subunit SecG
MIDTQNAKERGLSKVRSIGLFLSSNQPMQMQTFFNTLLKVSLLIFLLSGLTGLYFLSAEQYDHAMIGAKVGGLASLVFTAIVIGEVMAAKDARFLTKLCWIAAFLFFQIFAGFAYYFADRKSIYQKSEFS